MNYFGTDTEIINDIEWNWKEFVSTKDFPISKNLLDWVIGQDFALKECFLCLDEWVHKLKYLQDEKWYEPWLDHEAEKPVAKQVLTPGPYLLLLGDPGTGKSLMGRALAEKLTQIYAENEIKQFDVLAWPNKILPGNPKISIHEAGEGKKIVNGETKRGKAKSFFKSLAFKLLLGFILGIGLLLVGLAMYDIIMPWITNGTMSAGYFIINGVRDYYEGNFFAYFKDAFFSKAQILGMGGGICLSGLLLLFFRRIMGGGTVRQGIGGATSTNFPKLLIDNTLEKAPFIDATGHSSSQLFGSIAWDPYQTGGLGTPEHQRVTAGDVHRSSMGILYIDEIKNFGPEEAITLLTVLEDGQLPITLRHKWGGGHTSAMAVSTEPVPCMTFLVGAGNFDSINQLHPALMDRIKGYGRVVRMSNDMPNNIKNRRKYVQFIAQEANRFHMPPFSREACMEVIKEGRRKSNQRYKLTTKFRPLISVIKTAGTLALNEKSKLVEPKHVIEAVEEHCKSIQKQLLEHHIEERGKFMEINPEGNELGQIYGLAVIHDHYSKESTGSVLRVKAQMLKRKKKKLRGYLKVTGIAKEPKFMKGSIEKVRSVIHKKFDIDVEQEYFTHIDFSQAYGVDGPSAGVTMAILLCSLLTGKPIRQDVAVTGEINISSTDQIQITSIGGVHEKIKAAEAWGFKKVVIPIKNYKFSINPNEYKIKVVGASTLQEYLKEVLA